MLIAAVAIVVASATAKRDDGADLGACPQGRADVALLVSGSVRSFMIPNVYNRLKGNLIDFMASHCINVHPIMYLGLKEAAGIEHEGLPYPQAIPSDLDEALDHVNVAAVDFYEPTQYDSKQFPWGHCSKPVEYDRPTTVWAHFDKAQKLLCMARKVEKEKNIHFSWYMHSRPEYFWYGPPPVDFATTLWDGRGTDSAHAFIFDEDWRHMYNDALYAVHSSHADGILGPGSSILSKLPCRAEIPATGHVFHGRMTPETALHKVVDLVGAASRAVGIGFERSARPTAEPGQGTLSCVDYKLQRHIHPCERAQAISVSETKVYRAQVNQWRSLNAYADDPPMQSMGPTC